MPPEPWQSRAKVTPCSNTTGMVPTRPTAAAPFVPAPPSVSASVFRLDQSFITLEGARCEETSA